MNLRPKPAALLCAALLILALCAFNAPSKVEHPPVIVTAAPAYDALAALHGTDRFPKGAQLLLVDHGAEKPLVKGFAATADASVSFDAKRILFAGKKSETDAWAIWELTIADGAVRKVLAADVDLIRPLYLPHDRMVYARRTVYGFQPEAAGLDGSDITQLSFVRSSAIPQDVLADGRVLFESVYPLGTSLDAGGVPELYLMYSDGSGVESYRCDHGPARWGGRQVASGDVVFTTGSMLARFTSSLAEQAAVAAPKALYNGGIAETSSGAWLVSAKPPAAKNYVLAQWRRGLTSLTTVFAKSGNDLVEPVLLAARNRPKEHPSALHPWKYANLLTLDSRLSRGGDLKESPASVRLEAQDAFGKPVQMGTAPVESDGSFFVKVPGDTPIRFSLLDRKGAVIRQERGWFWIRSGEQRICVGCHTGPERASENRVPQILLRSTTPADLSSFKSAASAVQGSR